MPRSDLISEIASGVQFWGWDEAENLLGVMGLQKVRDATLIRHAYVRPEAQGRGIGGALLGRLASETSGPLLIGTWAAAEWAIRFYVRHGFHLVPATEKRRLLETYWNVPAAPAGKLGGTAALRAARSGGRVHAPRHGVMPRCPGSTLASIGSSRSERVGERSGGLPADRSTSFRSLLSRPPHQSRILRVLAWLRSSGESHEENRDSPDHLCAFVGTRVCDLQVGRNRQEARRRRAQELHDEMRARCEDSLRDGLQVRSTWPARRGTATSRSALPTRSGAEPSTRSERKDLRSPPSDARAVGRPRTGHRP